VVATTPDGAVHLSHYDREVNPTQIDLLRTFIGARPQQHCSIVGYHARAVAEAIHEAMRVPGLQIHLKPTCLEHNYSVRASRTDGKFTITHASTPLSEDYVPSAHHTEYGRWFAHGRFGQIFPPEDAAFLPTSFERA